MNKRDQAIAEAEHCISTALATLRRTLRSRSRIVQVKIHDFGDMYQTEIVVEAPTQLPSPGHDTSAPDSKG
jgi:hypothetical protein